MPLTSVTPEGLAYSPLVKDPKFGQLRPVFISVGEGVAWSLRRNEFCTPHPMEDALLPDLPPPLKRKTLHLPARTVQPA